MSRETPITTTFFKKPERRAKLDVWLGEKNTPERFREAGLRGGESQGKRETKGVRTETESGPIERRLMVHQAM